jgi:NADH-quinone oxidoreductase subunit M
MLYLYRRVIFGALTNDALKSITDLSPREMLVFAPLAAVVIWLGIYPMPVLDVMHVSVQNLVERLDVALAALDGASLAVR